MLKTPRSVQQCSSSPIKARLGSADRVVLPVPERPKKTVTSPLSPALADEWRGMRQLCLPGTNTVAVLHYAVLFSAADPYLTGNFVPHGEVLPYGLQENKVYGHRYALVRSSALILGFAESERRTSNVSTRSRSTRPETKASSNCRR